MYKILSEIVINKEKLNNILQNKNNQIEFHKWLKIELAYTSSLLQHENGFGGEMCMRDFVVLIYN